MQQFTRKPLAIAVTLALAYPQFSLAEEDKQLAGMTISQARPAAVVDNPSSQAQVTAEQLRDMNVVSTEDALKYVPSLNIRTRYIGDRNSIISARTSVGSVPSATSLVYADGLLLSNLLGNSYSYPPRWNLVAVSEIETVDVLYGPFSALLPGNSEGVTVLMTTRRPERTEAHVSVQTAQEKFSLYGTQGNYDSHQEQASGGFRVGNLSVSLLGNHLDAHGHPMSFATSTSPSTGAGVTGITGFSTDLDTNNRKRYVWAGYSIDHSIQDTAKIRMEYDFTPDTRAALTWAEFRNESDKTAESYLRDTSGNTVWGTTSGTAGSRYTNVSIGNGKYIKVKASDFGLSREDTLNRLLGVTASSKLTDQLRLEMAASDYSTPKDTNRAASDGMSAAGGGVGTITRGDDTGWRNLDLRSIWKPANHTVTTGYHYDEYRLSSLKYNTNNWLTDTTTTLQTKAEGKTRTDALYIQDAWKLAPRWTLTTGLRHEQWQAFDGLNYDKSKPTASGSFSDRSGSFNSPKASLAWQATSDWQLRASLARAYRMPTVNELFGTQTDAQGNATLADASLRPEKILASDLTAEGAFAGGSLRLSLFQEDKSDYILSQTTTTKPIITSVQNVDKALVQGAEVAYVGNDVLMHGLDFQGSITYADGTIKKDVARPAYEGRPLAIPRWRATAFATYHLNDAWSASAGIRYSSNFPQLDPAYVNWDIYGGASGYTVADVRLSYKFQKYMTASLGVNNLSNEKYYAFHPYPQRTVHAQLRIDY